MCFGWVRTCTPGLVSMPTIHRQLGHSLSFSFLEHFAYWILLIAQKWHVPSSLLKEKLTAKIGNSKNEQKNLHSFSLQPAQDPCAYSFSPLFTHIFWKHASCSQKATQIKKHTHIGQHPSILLQDESWHSKQCYFFSKWYFVFKWHTQTIIWIDIHKNQLNTDMLNVKCYDEWKALLYILYIHMRLP